MIFTKETVLDFIKKQTENKPEWIGKAREQHEILEALITGKDFQKLLIERIEHLESKERASARKKYAKLG